MYDEHKVILFIHLINVLEKTIRMIMKGLIADVKIGSTRQAISFNNSN